MDMVERVSRALAELHGDPDEDCKIKEGTCKYWKFHQKDALIAIKAMREPTEGMLIGMKRNIGPLKAMWQGSIDAALGEHK